jgi:DNA-binding CsgD family transcriptional regulator
VHGTDSPVVCLAGAAGAVGRDTLTPCEVATLVAVGRRLDNAEIAAEFSVSVRTVESHIAALRRQLQVGSRVGLIDAANDMSRRAMELPQNSFVGRDDDARARQSLLAAHRCVSVVGVACCGKTRVALVVAASGPRVPVVVDLQDAADVDVLRRSRVPSGRGRRVRERLLDACAVAPQARPHLLVIDNCDRVTEAIAATVGPLLARATSLAVLTTCRWIVGGTSEVMYELAPLPVGGPGAAAVRLFTDRLAVVRPGEVLNRAEASPRHRGRRWRGPSTCRCSGPTGSSYGDQTSSASIYR